MSDLTRAEIEEFWETWLQVNRDCERTGDWRPMAEWYAEDTTYGWMLTPDEHFMAVGRDQVRDWAIGIEMDGFDGWHYDYVCTVIDEQKAMVIGLWKQRSGILDDATGKEYEVAGLGGSWFGLKRVTEGADAGQVKIDWQRDWFDFGSMSHTMMAILSSGKAPDTLKERVKVFGHDVPGHYHAADLPSTVWPPPVEAGEYVTQVAAPEVTP
ncbi:nuclear transport factor 2 family protein [Nocardioides marinus]|jgi:hypothetical protein|uniref:SnoaL-like domain-containing protein n=1 Tax=Nocardioides marinus TaxID=374514 RepID=A0A7Y9YFC4_9ACTN|nr:nuclear transport factor 2 family protein [Nocardioides marinus]NYI09977.1 hypothetical protein [Nocardioides marinus]